MVDVSEKQPTARCARAQCRVRFPRAIAQALVRAGWRGSKGPILDTATIAGVMAAKRTHELIPFCHPLGLDRCEIRTRILGDGVLVIECETAVTGRTGVEMEALVGASIAALTVYDMTKALGHGVVLERVRLLEKRGGKRDYRARGA